jgi:flagellar hook-associated protein FlgK
MQMDGVVRVGVVDNTTGNYIKAPLDLDLTAGPQTINAVIATINAYLGADGTAALNADGQLVVTATNANQGVAMVSMTDPEAKQTVAGSGNNLGFSHYFGLNDLFTTGARFIGDGVAGKVGLTQSLDIRADIKETPSFLSRGMASTEAFVTHPNAIRPGDGRIMTKMMAAFEASLDFSAAGPMGARSESLLNYANSIWHNAAVDSKNNKSLYEVQNTILEENETELKARTRVNMQSQIAQLMEAQRIYAASTTLLKANKEMLQQLMSAI